MVNIRIQRPRMRKVLTLLKLCDPALTCITASARPCVGRILIGQWKMIDLRLLDAGDLAMTFGAAPDPARTTAYRARSSATAG